MKRKTYSYLLSAILALCTMMIFTSGLHTQAVNPSPTPTAFDRPGDCTADISISVTALSPNGKYLLAKWADGRAARLWDVQTGKVLHTFVETPIISAAFSPSSQHVLIGSYDGTSKLWDISRGTMVYKLTGNPDASKGFLAWVTNVSFSPDGKYILTGDATGGYLWDTTTGTKLRSFPGQMERSDNVAFSPDGKRVLMDSTDDGVSLWDVQSGRKIHSFNDWMGVFSPDNQYVLTFTRQNLSLWDAQKFTLVRTFDGGKMRSFDSQGWVVFSPNSRYLITYSGDDGALLWDIQTGIKLHTLESVWPVFAVFFPNNEYLLTQVADVTLGVWNIRTGQEVRRFVIGGSPASVPQITPDSKYAAVATLDDKLQLWDLQTGKIVRRFC